MKKKNILWGILFIVLGIIIALNSLGITNINLFFDGWWTLFIIVPAIVGLFQEENKTGNIIWLLIGFALFLGVRDIINFELIFKLMFPSILIIIGVSLIFKKNQEEEKIPDVKNEDEYISTFSSQVIDLEDNDFKGCNIDAVFGGIKCELSNSNIKNNSVINASAIFGGIDIIVPKDIKVIVKQTSIFGGVSNKHKNSKEFKKTLFINTLCLFGGIEIHEKNTKNN